VADVRPAVRTVSRPWHGRARAWLAEQQWPLTGLAWLVTLGLGIVGYTQHLAAADKPVSGWDALYRALQLFVLEGEQLSGEMIWEFEVARLLAPVVAGYTALQGIGLLFAERVAKLRCRFARGHVVICGLGSKGFRLAGTFRDQGYRVIAIELDPDAANTAILREQGITILTGDAASEEALRTANVASASHVFAVCGDDGVNAEVAVQVRAKAATRRAGVLTCHAHVVDLPLCRLLREQLLTGPRASAFRLEFFNIYESGARALLAAHPIVPHGDQPVHLLIVGMGRMGEALVLQAAHQWRAENRGAPLRVSVVDCAANERVTSLRARFPHLADVCEILALEIDVRSTDFEAGEFLTDESGTCTVSRAVVCLPSDAMSVSAALTLHQRCDGVPIVARVFGRGGLQVLLSDCEGVEAFSLLDETCAPEILLRGINETLAQAMHEDYLHSEQAKGHELRSRPAMFPWDELTETLREANRGQVDCLTERLAAFGYRIASLTDWEAERFQFSPDEIEGMSRIEHDRWCAERRSQGYTWGEERDDRRKRHPDLVVWEELDEETREKDRQFVRSLPAFLARVGFQVQRISRP